MIEFLAAMRYNPLVRGAVWTTIGVMVVALACRYSMRNRRNLRRTLTRTSLGLLSFMYALAAAEAGLYLFFTESHGSLATLASARWFARYWNPINAAGFRDHEYDDSALAGKKLLGVVGDSFAAGHGIKRIDDRFGDVLGDMLGPDWMPVTLAMPGWGMGEEYDAISSYPRRLDAIVLAYAIGDVTRTAARHGLKRDTPRAMSKPTWLKPWINRSNLVNLIYSRWYTAAHPSSRGDFWTFIDRCFTDEAIWAAHQDEMRRIVGWCQDHDTDLYVLLIPALPDVETSRAYTSKVADVFRAQGVGVVDMSTHLANRPRSSLVVNPVDPHANVAVHREMARHLYELFIKVHASRDVADTFGG